MNEKLIEAVTQIEALTTEWRRRAADWERMFLYPQARLWRSAADELEDVLKLPSEERFHEYERIAHGMCHRAGCKCPTPLLGWTECNTPRCRLCNVEVESPRPQPSEEKWQPIETAPKDGTLVLGWCEHWDAPTCVLWQMNYRVGGELWTFIDEYPEEQPTHWMLLPPKPRESHSPATGGALQKDEAK